MASTYVVERKATINAPRQAVFDRIANFERWPEWSPWEELDPDMEKTYTGTAGEVGSGYSWTGNRKAGAGSMKMTAIDAPSSMGADLSFLKPFKSENTLVFDLAEVGEGTEVTWTMHATHSLVTRVMSMFGLMDKMIGKDFDKGLAKLKTLSEA
jgi:hypothetical protein